MRIDATDFNGRDVRLSMEAENEAERHQLRAIKERLDKADANWQEFDDMEGRRGIVIVAEKRSDKVIKRNVAHDDEVVNWYSHVEVREMLSAERERWTLLLTDKWHAGDANGQTLAQYMGMTDSEYAAWVLSP